MRWRHIAIIQHLSLSKRLTEFSSLQACVELRCAAQRVAWACCWLATKLEENPRRVQDLLCVFNRIDQRREGKPLEPLDRYSQVRPNLLRPVGMFAVHPLNEYLSDPSVALQRYAALKNDIIEVERYILRELGFILHVEHPHKSVLNYLTVFDGELRLKQEAWNLTNDR